MTATAQKEGARRTDSPRPQSGSHRHPEQGTSSSVLDGRERVKRKGQRVVVVPDAVLAIANAAQRTAVALWGHARCHGLEDGFCWPSAATLAAEIGASERTVKRHLLWLQRERWIERGSVRRVPRGRQEGWVLHQSPSPERWVPPAELRERTWGPMFREVEATAPLPEPAKVGMVDDQDWHPHPLQEAISEAIPCAHAREEQPQGVESQDAQARAVWDAHEAERHEQLGGRAPREPNADEIRQIRGLVAYVARRERLTAEDAVLRVLGYSRALVASAARERRARTDKADRYAARCVWGSWRPGLYELVMAREAPPRARAVEWQPEPDPPPPPECDPKISAMADAFLANIRPLEAP